MLLHSPLRRPVAVARLPVLLLCRIAYWPCAVNLWTRLRGKCLINCSEIGRHHSAKLETSYRLAYLAAGRENSYMLTAMGIKFIVMGAVVRDEWARVLG